MKLKTFLEVILPSLRKQAKDQKDLMTKITATVDGDAIVDAEGNEVDIASIDLGTAAPAEDAPADEAPAEGAASITPEQVRAMVREVVKASQPKAAISGDPGTGIVPATVKRYGRLRNLKTEESAYTWGQFLGAVLYHKEKSVAWCKDHGILLQKAHDEVTGSSGGVLVPDQLENEIIDLKEQYGVFRQNARVVPMTSDTDSIPRRESGLTAYFVGDNAAITESTMGWDRVSLVAKKLGVLAKYSSELAEDAIISVGDALAGEIAYAFALKEDQCGFIGTGSAAYGGMHGVQTKIAVASGATYAGSIHDALSGNTYFGVLDMVDFNGVVGLLPQYAEANAKWYISKPGFHASMERLASAAGGNTRQTIAGGKTELMFLGYPVVISQVMFATLTASVNTIHCLFGDLSKAAMFGDRRSTTIATSEHVNFAEDEIAIRGTTRFDINVHDLGSATVAGPIVALKTPGS